MAISDDELALFTPGGSRKAFAPTAMAAIVPIVRQSMSMGDKIGFDRDSMESL